MTTVLMGIFVLTISNAGLSENTYYKVFIDDRPLQLISTDHAGSLRLEVNQDTHRVSVVPPGKIRIDWPTRLTQKGSMGREVIPDGHLGEMDGRNYTKMGDMLISVLRIHDRGVYAWTP